jgi:hypothetical protein
MPSGSASTYARFAETFSRESSRPWIALPPRRPEEGKEALAEQVP